MMSASGSVAGDGDKKTMAHRMICLFIMGKTPKDDGTLESKVALENVKKVAELVEHLFANPHTKFNQHAWQSLLVPIWPISISRNAINRACTKHPKTELPAIFQLDSPARTFTKPIETDS